MVQSARFILRMLSNARNRNDELGGWAYKLDVIQVRIYLAGPYQPTSKDKHQCVRETAQNTDRAIVTGLELMKKGHVVYIPHLAHFIHTHHKCDGEWPWRVYDRSFLEHWAEALYFMGASKGANAELRRAKELDLKIFYRLNRVPKGRDMIE